MVQSGHWSAGAALTLIASIIAASAVGAIAYMVYKRRELQPLKIRSPTLLTLFLIGNTCTIVLMFIVQMNVELD